MKTLLMLSVFFCSSIFGQNEKVIDSTNKEIINQDSLHHMKRMKYIAGISAIGIATSVITIKNTTTKYLTVFGIYSNLCGYHSYGLYRTRKKTTILTLLGSYGGAVIGSYASYQIINHWDSVRRTARRGSGSVFIYPLAIVGIAICPVFSAGLGAEFTSREKESSAYNNNFRFLPFYALSSKKHTFGLQIYH